jgi:hypothetical protein
MRYNCPKQKAMFLAAQSSPGPPEFLNSEVKTAMSSDPRAEYDAVAGEVTATSSAITGKMFGMPCLKNNGKAFAGFYQDAMVFKLKAPRHGEALALSGAHLFDPSGRDRPMKEWVEVPFEHASRWLKLAREALQYVDEAH